MKLSSLNTKQTDQKIKTVEIVQSLAVISEKAKFKAYRWQLLAGAVATGSIRDEDQKEKNIKQQSMIIDSGFLFNDDINYVSRDYFDNRRTVWDYQLQTEKFAFKFFNNQENLNELFILYKLSN